MPRSQGILLWIPSVPDWTSSSRLSGEDFYLLVSLRVVGGGGTTASVARFPRRTCPTRPNLPLLPMGVECLPKRTRAGLGSCIRLLRPAWDGDGLLEDAPPYVPCRPCSTGPWSPLQGGDTRGRNVLACYMRDSCSSSVAQSDLYRSGKDPAGLFPP